MLSGARPCGLPAGWHRRFLLILGRNRSRSRLENIMSRRKTGSRRAPRHESISSLNEAGRSRNRLGVLDLRLGFTRAVIYRRAVGMGICRVVERTAGSVASRGDAAPRLISDECHPFESRFP